mgnify:CR=1 FL=1
MLTKQRLELINLSQALQKLKISEERKTTIKQTLKALQIQREVDIYNKATKNLSQQDKEKLENHKINLLKLINENVWLWFTEEQAQQITKKEVFKYLKTH